MPNLIYFRVVFLLPNSLSRTTSPVFIESKYYGNAFSVLYMAGGFGGKG